MTILIIDDDMDIRKLLTVFLAYNGYTAVPVPHGMAAFDHLRHEELPELILLDMKMPVMDGAAFRRTQQGDARLANIPVVVMSGAENLNAQVPTLTANAYLPKPFDFVVLLELVERYCGQRRKRGCDYSIQP